VSLDGAACRGGGAPKVSRRTAVSGPHGDSGPIGRAGRRRPLSLTESSSRILFACGHRRVGLVQPQRGNGRSHRIARTACGMHGLRSFRAAPGPGRQRPAPAAGRSSFSTPSPLARRSLRASLGARPRSGDRWLPCTGGHRRARAAFSQQAVLLLESLGVSGGLWLLARIQAREAAAQAAASSSNS